jgi:hypothetical protein
MKAMLEPKIVAARTHGLDLPAHGVSRIPDRITASSHGCLILNLDAHGVRTIPARTRIFQLFIHRDPDP